MKFEFFDHTADAKFRAYGDSLEEAFTNAAYAMCSIMYDYTKIKPAHDELLEAEGKDSQALLYSFLEELLFLLDTKGFLLAGIKKLEIKEGKITATLLGDINLDQYELQSDVKAVTYNDMEIGKYKGKDYVQVVVDI